MKDAAEPDTSGSLSDNPSGFTLNQQSSTSVYYERPLNRTVGANSCKILGVTTSAERVDTFGFKSSEGGAHISRTIMLTEISRLISVAGETATFDDYRRAVIDENILSKRTETTRQKTLRHLRELYALSGDEPIFAVYRELVWLDRESLPLLSLLIAWARDPLLRATTPAILNSTFGDRVSSDDFQQALTEAYPHQYSANNIGKIARNAASTISFRLKISLRFV